MDQQELFNFAGLPQRDRALICLAVLLDRETAAQVLACHADRGQEFSAVAGQLALLQDDVRIPIVGTILRSAIDAPDFEDDQIDLGVP